MTKPNPEREAENPKDWPLTGKAGKRGFSFETAATKQAEQHRRHHQKIRNTQWTNEMRHN